MAVRIKKVKVDGEFIYPATIANAVKDINFKNSEGEILTQSEINSELKSKVESNTSILDDIRVKVEKLTNSNHITRDDIYLEDNILVFKNLKENDIEESILAMEKAINESQIIMLPGGFSAGDEPDGSGKFIATVFRNPKIAEALNEFLTKQDGLMLGICNGFQALIKLGLVPYGEVRECTVDAPTLTYNNIGRHQAKVVTTRIASNKSPWLAETEVGDIHKVAISHGEGKFVANEEVFKQLLENGQIATQYVDLNGEATYDIEFNPNGSYFAVEGITSADGRVFGKMGHSERIGEYVMKNITKDIDKNK